MRSANVNDRSTIEAIYPREAFESDAAQNSRDKAAILHGVLIASEVSESGAFALLRDIDARMEQAPAYGAAEEKPGGLEEMERQGADYDSFIDRIIAAATRAEFKEPIGRHEERLRGFRGG
jgi:hypothetical protein